MRPIDADQLLDHIEKMYKIGCLQSIDDVRFAIMDAPEIPGRKMHKVTFTTEGNLEFSDVMLPEWEIPEFMNKKTETNKEGKTNE